MPNIEIVVEVHMEWSKEGADLSECSVCGEVMVSNTNVWHAFVGDYNPQPLIKVCNSCFNAIEDANTGPT